MANIDHVDGIRHFPSLEEINSSTVSETGALLPASELSMLDTLLQLHNALRTDRDMIVKNNLEITAQLVQLTGNNPS